MAYENAYAQTIVVAYLIAKEAEIETESIRKALGQQFPDCILPAYFVWMREFPKNTSGEIDKEALPKLQLDELTLHDLHSNDETVLDLFRKQVEITPDELAIVFYDKQITYRQLDQKSNQLARYLRKCGIKEKMLVPVCINRSLEMIIGILGILKAGAAYVPIDPDYPQDRIEYMLADTGTNLVVTNTQCGKAIAANNKTPELIYVDSDWLTIENESEEPVLIHLSLKSPINVLYTSGSTGKPKGVCLTHGGLINFLHWQVKFSAAKPGLNTLQFCHFSFDASFQEIFVPLITGGTIYLIDDSYRLDSYRLLDFIIQQKISRVFLPYVVLQYLAEVSITEAVYPTQLIEIITGGELLKITPQIARFFEALPGCTLVNVYGPTETSIWVTENKLVGSNVANWPKIPTIGKPVADCAVYIVDETLQLLADGEVGEICISGVCLANGYLNQPALTAEKFIDWQHPDNGAIRLYRTGDLACYLPDGQLEFYGRRDSQVKIRGNRVEPGEIEVALTQQQGVQQAVVMAREDVPGDKTLVAYLIANSDIQTAKIREELANQLPAFMIPSYFILMDELPKTISGKVDRNRLPKPDYKRPELVTVFKNPTAEIEKNITAIWLGLLQLDRIGLNDNFFELGGNSLLAQRTVAALKQQLDYTLPITKLYQYPTVAGIVKHLQKKENLPARKNTKNKQRLTSDDIAVIGMAGRFPGANTIAELWDVLKEGKETTHFFTDNELDSSIPYQLRNDPTYVRARGVLDKADEFDAHFFGLNPRLAELTDPQQRIFLEIAWETLEQTGYLPQQYDGIIGVYAGCGANTYYLHNVLPNQHLIDQVGSLQVTSVNEKDYIASRTAYQLNLKGPAVSVHAACSTSLLAIAQAVDSIRSGRCDVALAGGASVTSPINSGHLYQEGAILSRDGHCRPFDNDAQGTVFSDGAGVVLLKSLDAAIRDGDKIYSVIKGAGVNNDGGGKGSFTAPSAEGQAGAIMMALDDAQVDPATISYVEAHGTATPIGDPIEIEGLTMAFGDQVSTQYCAIGSIKSNMGHLTAAAGVAGFIKTTLALYHKQIPASVGFSTPNPTIDFVNSPFFVNTKLTDWQSTVADYTGPRRAGVSSFGVGGTNVHVILEEHTADESTVVPDKPMQQRPAQLITWSAKSTASREEYGHVLAKHLQQNSQLNLTDVAFTLQTTKADFNHRRFVLADSVGGLVDTLLADKASSSGIKTVHETPGEVVFLFPGQGSQYLNMGRELYENEPAYRQAIDECAELLHEHLEIDIRQVMYPDEINRGAEERLKNTRFTQPALFVTEYALAKLWMSWGIEPSVFCGHSIGEFVGAHLAGVFTLADALKLIAVRGRLVSELPRGSMLSVRMETDKIGLLMPEPLSIAAINSSKLCVVAGHDEDIASFASVLDSQEIPNQVLQTSHAFHSVMMDPAVADFQKVVETVLLNRPQKPIVSTVSGTWLTDSQATDPHYWATHLRLTVRFADALEFIYTLNRPLLLEVGPGNVTTTLARQQAGSRPVNILTSLDKKESKEEYESILKAVGQLWLNGLTPDWKTFYNNQNTDKLTLPTYSFDRKRCWVDPIKQVPPVVQYIPVAQALSVNYLAEILPHPDKMRKDVLIDKVKEMLEDASGIEMEGVTSDMSFLEIGLDSLLLTQVSLTFKKEFGLPITFRQLNEEYATLDALVDYLDTNLPAGAYAQNPVPAPTSQPVTHIPAFQHTATAQPGSDSVLELMAQQLQILSKQVAIMQGGNQVPVSMPMHQPAVATVVTAPAVNGKPVVSKPADLTPEEEIEIKKPFGASARIERQATELNPKQNEFLQQLIDRYSKKTGGSKSYTQEHRDYMADPRVVSGFKPLTKEVVYPIVINKSKGSRLWDVDGNEYVDMLNGFGSNMFGYQPDFIKDALHNQIEKGFEIGPQHELAGEVSRLIADFTGFDRVALCSTGSEAVLGAMRIARTVTGRSLIVAFSGSYHGIVDEVIVRGTKKLKSFPAAPGIMPESVQNMLILDYGTDESLKIIRERAHELAAVLVEPVQSRRPEFIPLDFLKQVREITAASETALIFDEVITGFRMHPGGAQALFGIKADLASYGKVVGGGLPIGVIAGIKNYMDALDGGTWQFGDGSFPEKGVTYFAGTFVRHPLALAAAKASLLHLKAAGPDLQKAITNKANRIASALNREFERHQLPFYVAQFGSLWKIKPKEEIPYSELLFTLMREKGVHIWDGFPCFITEAHTDAEVDLVIKLFSESINEMIAADFFKTSLNTTSSKEGAAPAHTFTKPPVPNAKLGRDKEGNPAWFIVDPEQPGKYRQFKVQ